MASRPPPFRAEHIGSLFRSPALVKRRAELGPNARSEDDPVLKQIEDDDIRRAVKLQQDLGFVAITDGEFRRALYWGPFFLDLEGFEERHITPADADELFRPYGCDIKLFTEAGEKGGDTVICTGKIKHVKSSYLEHFEFVKSLVPPDQVKYIKITLGSPEWYHMRYKPEKAYPSGVYASDKEYFDDIAAAFRAELRTLYDAGMRNVVIDNPNFGFCCDPTFAAGWAEDKTNTLTVLEQLRAYIDLMNDCLRDLPPAVHTGVHLCRGNFMSRHWASGGYTSIAAELFTRSNVHTFYLEYDTPRAGTLQPLALLPADKNVVLGLVTTKFGEIEDAEELKGRVFEAARYMAKGSGQTEAEALHRISVSPQCGFASAYVGNLVTEQDQIAKLRLVRRLAAEIWPGEA